MDSISDSITERYFKSLKQDSLIMDIGNYPVEDQRLVAGRCAETLLNIQNGCHSSVTVPDAISTINVLKNSNASLASSSELSSSRPLRRSLRNILKAKGSSKALYGSSLCSSPHKIKTSHKMTKTIKKVPPAIETVHSRDFNDFKDNDLNISKNLETFENPLDSLDSLEWNSNMLDLPVLDDRILAEFFIPTYLSDIASSQ